MKRKLTFLIESHLDQRDYIRYGIQYLASRYSVQILDCTNFIYPKIPKQLNVSVDAGYKYTSISSAQELVNLDPVGTGSIIIDMLGETYSGDVVRRHILQKGGLRIVLRVGKVYLSQVSFLERVKRLIFKVWKPTTVQIFLELAVRAVSKKLLPVKPIDLLIHGGIDDDDVIKARFVIYAHSLDYDRWRTLPRFNLAHQGEYALFLDEDMVYHPDLARFRVLPLVTEAVYYSAINRFFNEYQRYTGIPVYIAAHPRAQYSKRPHLWGNRKLLHGQTPEAVNGASQIFVHFSTSISFAILANKPITHLISDELMKSFLGYQIVGVSQFLNTPLLNIDYELQEDVALTLNQINITRYLTYINRYIKAEGSPEAPLWEIIADEAERLLVVAV